MKPEMKHRMRRSMLFVPGANAAMVSNAFIYKADALMFDLEDSVILREKDAARRQQKKETSFEVSFYFQGLAVL